MGLDRSARSSFYPQPGWVRVHEPGDPHLQWHVQRPGWWRDSCRMDVPVRRGCRDEYLERQRLLRARGELHLVGKPVAIVAAKKAQRDWKRQMPYDTTCRNVPGRMHPAGSDHAERRHFHQAETQRHRTNDACRACAETHRHVALDCSDVLVKRPGVLWPLRSLCLS